MRGATLVGIGLAMAALAAPAARANWGPIGGEDHIFLQYNQWGCSGWYILGDWAYGGGRMWGHGTTFPDRATLKPEGAAEASPDIAVAHLECTPQDGATVVLDAEASLLFLVGALVGDDAVYNAIGIPVKPPETAPPEPKPAPPPPPVVVDEAAIQAAGDRLGEDGKKALGNLIQALGGAAAPTPPR
jgi:hypothetical protein